MSQSNIEQISSKNTVITELLDFQKYGITAETLDLYERTQKLQANAVNEQRKRLIFRISIGLLIAGLVLILLSLIALIVVQSWTVAVFGIFNTILEGFFFWGYKHFVKHYFVVPIASPNPSGRSDGAMA